MLDTPIAQDPLPTLDLVLALATPSEVERTQSEASLVDKHKKKHLVGGSSKKHKKKKGEMSSTFLPSSSAQARLWKPKFSIAKLGK